ncbi:uncharacterized protein METZ01_LOCUS362286 [marine metagenome]|uniref:Uncharacterized protein n=1 Tax=marine metagenome TaxID=408172 RepID=A0A382SIQ5_9ZZZZ
MFKGSRILLHLKYNTVFEKRKTTPFKMLTDALESSFFINIGEQSPNL